MRHRRNCGNPASPINPAHGPIPGTLKNKTAALSLLFFLFVCASLPSARADDHIRAVRLSNVVGSVQILSGAQTEFSQAYPNMPLLQGSTLKTGEDGRAEIQFEDGSVIRVTPNSSVAMSVLSRGSDGKTNTEIDLLTGLSYVEMKAAAGQRFVVHFNGNQVVSTTPLKFRVNLDANPVELAVTNGTAHLSNGTDYALDVHANETVRFDVKDGNRYFLAEGVDGSSWDQWNADRDQAMGQMAAMETREARGSANPENPGWSDLDYYGNWYSSPNGSVWAPSGAGPGWDPYGSGYWGYYGSGGGYGGGYSWISGYPWGWLPYQCGGWNYYNSMGWGWSPGGCGGLGGYGGYPGFGYGGNIGTAPPRYHRLPHPNPVQRVGGVAAGQHLIAVDRGPEATRLEPHLGQVPRTIQLNGQPAHLIAKSPNTTNTLVGKTGSPIGRSGAVAVGRTAPGFVGQNGFGERPVSNIPAFRPTASTYRANTPAFRAGAPGSSARSGASSSSFGSRGAGQTSMSSMSAASSASHMGGVSSASHGGGGGGGGGGHTK